MTSTAIAPMMAEDVQTMTTLIVGDYDKISDSLPSLGLGEAVLVD